MLGHMQSPLRMTSLSPGFHFSLYVCHINGMLFPRIGHGTAIAMGLGFWVHRKKVYITQKWGASHSSAIPQYIRHSAALPSFRSKLKTFLLSEYFMQHCPSPLSVCTVWVCVCVCVCVRAHACVRVCVYLAHSYAWTHVNIYIMC